MRKLIDIKDNKFGIRLMNNHEHSDINDFFILFHNCFGKRFSLDKEWFNWYYNENPFGVCNNYLLYDLENEFLVGAYGFAKIPYHYNNKDKIGVLGVNAMIDRNYLRKGLFTYLMNVGLKNETKNNLGFSFPHGQNIGSVKGHIKSNWSVFENLYFYNKKLTNTNTVVNSNVRELELDEIKKINFKLFSKNSLFHFIKNHEFINWRYLNRPHKEYIIIGNFISKNEINGYMVLGKYTNKSNIIRCQIADYGVQDISVLKKLLIKAELIAKIIDSEIIDLIISENSNEFNEYKKLGYSKSNEFYKLMVYPEIKKNIISNALLGDFDAI